jgi:putative membrane-bound dehydrogenase-like protein
MKTRPLARLQHLLVPIAAAALNAPTARAASQANPVAQSAVLTARSPQRVHEVEADLNRAKELFLAVSSEGDISCDWADWIEPEIVLADGAVIDLTTLRWRSSKQGSGSTVIGLNNQNKPITVDGKFLTKGIGTHADSLIAYDLPAGASKFRAKVAIDDGGMKRDGKLSGASVKFMVFTAEPTSGQLTGQEEATEVPLELFALPAGLEATIWAKTPLLRNPTNIDFDAKGRLWVAEGVNYRSKGNRQTEGDRIVILEDTTGSGSADKSTVFVQETDLASPLGIAVFENRVVVSQPPNLLVYTDVNEDGKFDPEVDKREVLLTGFGGRQHDHSLHSVTAGPDGLWYWNQGNTGAEFTDKSGKTFRMGSPYQKQNLAGLKSDDGHVWIGGFAVRMNPDGSNVTVIGHNFRNSYEQAVTSLGDVFQSDNDDPPACRVTAMMEGGNAGFASADGKRSWGADRRPNQTVPVAEWRQEDPGTMPAGDVYGGGAPTGVAFYENGALGKNWEGLLLACESGKNVVFGYLPKPDGAGWKLEREDFFTSNKAREWAGSDFLAGAGSTTLKNWFRPSDVCVGPDGAIYVADWYDARVGGHGTRDDRTTGAIYRIAPKGFKSQVPKFDLTTTLGQITALKSPSANIRYSGFSRLKAQGEKAVPAVAELLQDPNPYIAARAIWLLAQMGETGSLKVRTLLDSKDESLRLVAYRSLHRAGHDRMALACRFADDPSPAIRREIALHLRDVSAAKSVPLLDKIASNFDGKDRAYLEAIGLGSDGKESAVYAEISKRFAKNPEDWDEAAQWLTWRLHPVEATEAITERAQSPKVTPEQRNLMLTALAFITTRQAADSMISIAANKKADTAASALWWLLYRKNNDWQPFDIASALKERGIYNPTGIKLVPVEMPPAVTAASPLPSIQEILQMRGDASRGSTAVGACYACHKIAGQGTEFGPNLTEFAKQQTPETILEAICKPSATISHGYEGSTVITKDGITITGILQSNGDTVILKSMGNLTQQIPREMVKSTEKLNRSLMYDPEQLGLTGQTIADIVAYLRSL